MTKSFTKIVLIFIFISITGVARAQLGYNFSHYAVGFGAGYNTVYGDAETQKQTLSVHFNLTYNVTPYTNFVLEAQLGTLAGGDSLTTKSGRQFSNDFHAFIFRGQLQMGELIDYSQGPVANAFKNFYVSTGIGMMYNNINVISRTSHLVADYYTQGVNKSNGPFIPFRLGYEFKVYNQYDQPAFNIDLGYNYNVMLGDELDGFNAGTKNDIYTQFTIGVKFAIGGDIVSYRKLIHY